MEEQVRYDSKIRELKIEIIALLVVGHVSILLNIDKKNNPAPIYAPYYSMDEDIIRYKHDRSYFKAGTLLPLPKQALAKLWVLDSSFPMKYGNNQLCGPTVLVLSPSREPATQIQKEVIRFGHSSRISCNVNHTKRELHNVFIRKLYRENLFEDMLKEPDDIMAKRKRIRETLQVLQQANKTLDELPLDAETAEKGYSLDTDSTGLPRIHGLSSSFYASNSGDFSPSYMSPSSGLLRQMTTFKKLYDMPIPYFWLLRIL